MPDCSPLSLADATRAAEDALAALTPGAAAPTTLAETEALRARVAADAPAGEPREAALDALSVLRLVLRGRLVTCEPGVGPPPDPPE